jgi:two-component system, chemotaxis family, sensor kinase CheA
LNTPDNIELFKQSFREEAREILVDLESALLELNENPRNGELISRVFRGLHTIKGSGAMFGFDDLAAFTHNLETAFDAVRTGKLAIDSELIDLTLAALDQIKNLLEAEEGVADTGEAACREQLLAKVRQLAGIAAATTPEAKPKVGERPASAKETRVCEWRVQFAPGPEFLLNGSNPFLLIQELRQLGGLSVRASMAAVPPLAELNPDRCYVNWEMVLSGPIEEDAIRDVFIFVEDCCELKIEPLADISQTAAEAVDRAAGTPSTGGRRLDDKPSSTTTLRVPAAKLDQFVDLVGELVTVQARLSELAARRDDAEVTGVSEEIERLTSALRENSMNIRMVPIRATFEKFRRLVHDLARDLGKAVELTIDGAETELDKTVIEQLGDPLLHLIRNSMDHGIEAPELRSERGKRATATIHLSARHAGASVLIEVKDDGGGIDAEAVRARAIEKGLIAAGAQLTRNQVFALIFEPGFSTARQVTDVSGRGVGMDVVRNRVERLRGSIEVSSAPGEGTSVALRLPLTLAIIDGLLVRVGQSDFVLPLANTLECIELSKFDIERANGKHVVLVREEIIPYIRLREYFNVSGRPPELEQIMVVETEGGRYGFVVDEVLGDCQTVIKSLSRFYRNVQVISGATILGNGSVALILDPERLAQEAVRTMAGIARGHPTRISRHGLQRMREMGTGLPCAMGAGETAGASQGNIQPA